jgi:hypothetical protein
VVAIHRLNVDISSGSSFDPGDPDSDSDDDSDDETDNKEQDFYRLRSGRNVTIGDDDLFATSQSGQRIIPPDKFGQSVNLRERTSSPDYRNIGFPGKNMSAYSAFTCGRAPAKKIRSAKLNQQYSNSLDWDRCINMLRSGGLGAMWAQMELHADQLEDTIEQMHPGLYSMKANSDDNPTWNQAMGGPDTKGY